MLGLTGVGLVEVRGVVRGVDVSKKTEVGRMKKGWRVAMQGNRRMSWDLVEGRCRCLWVDDPQFQVWLPL